jgi:hypothetical protein
MACPDIPRAFKCESHYDRVCRDLKEVSERTGFDFLVFADFMFKSPDYSIAGFPKLISTESGFKFDLAFRTDFRSATVRLINSQTQEVIAVTSTVYDKAVTSWHQESEKGMWREKLKSVGIDVQW